MKQLFQDLANGVTQIIEAPAPKVSSTTVLIDTAVSLISAGTERMLVDFGKAGLLSKARQQPEKVAQVLEKVRTDGLLTTIDAVRSKLGQPLALGYCNVGVVRDVGANTSGFLPGDRVVSNGSHADVVRVPANLVAKIPDNVPDEHAAFTVVASIGLQGMRLAEPTLGESFAVVGVGLIGLLTVQLLRANGCRVLAIDFDEKKLELARGYGAETCNPSAGQDPVAAGMAFSRGQGIDGVIITASTTSNDPVSQAARMCRKRGRIVLVGVTGLELKRADFYEKEIMFQVSCAYGPGRYDPNYEDKGHDYPVGFVRWTENRNFIAILDMMSSGHLDVSKLITHRFDFDGAAQAYEVLYSAKDAIGIVLNYNRDTVAARHTTLTRLGETPSASSDGTAVVGFIGAGNYASRILIPAFKEAGAKLHTIASSGGTSGVIHGRRAGFAAATTDNKVVFEDGAINAVAIATRHNTHASLVREALAAGKHVFVEKPLATEREDLSKLKATYDQSDRKLMVGFNRRFAPQVRTMKELLDVIHEPKTFVMMMNAGAIPPQHWTQDDQVGGGRIIGEACHFVDLMRHLAGARIVSIQARRMGAVPSVPVSEDKAAIVLGFEDGSFGTIHYLANGGSSFPKERIEVFAAGGTLQLDNFVRLTGYNWPGFRKQRLLRQDKGQSACAKAFIDAIKGGLPSPIPADELFEVAEATITAADLLRAQT